MEFVNANALFVSLFMRNNDFNCINWNENMNFLSNYVIGHFKAKMWILYIIYLLEALVTIIMLSLGITQPKLITPFLIDLFLILSCQKH